MDDEALKSVEKESIDAERERNKEPLINKTISQTYDKTQSQNNRKTSLFSERV